MILGLLALVALVVLVLFLRLLRQRPHVHGQAHLGVVGDLLIDTKMLR